MYSSKIREGEGFCSLFVLIFPFLNLAPSAIYHVFGPSAVHRCSLCAHFRAWLTFSLCSFLWIQQIVLFPYSLILTLCVLFIWIWKSHLVLYGKLGVWHNCHQITYSADANTWQCNPLEIIKNNLPVPYGRVLQKCVWSSYMF